jgi:ABC-type glycerol-3-phosphate transport system substrate-binding protein
MKSTFLALTALLLLAACGPTPQSDADTHRDVNIHDKNFGDTVGSCNMNERRKAQCR